MIDIVAVENKYDADDADDDDDDDEYQEEC